MRFVKVLGSIAGTMLLSSILALPVRAQIPPPAAEEQLQNILSTHPEAASNPNLLLNPGWLDQHPDVKKFMADHPNIRTQVREGGIGRFGAFDQGHVWRSASWWHQNQPEYVYANHPEWAQRYGWASADYKAHPDWFKGHADYWNQHRPAGWRH